MEVKSAAVIRTRFSIIINRKVDSSYGTKVKDQKKEKAKAEKSISKIRTWVVNEKKYEGLFLDLDDNGNLINVTWPTKPE